MWTMLIVQILLIGLNAVFACAEIAVLSVNETKMEHMAKEGNKSAGRIESFLKSPERFLATIQVAITLSGFLGSAFAADNFAGALTDWLISLGVSVSRSTLQTISVVLITLILSYFTLVFGELVPKRLAMRKAEDLSLKMSGLLKAVSVIFKPLVWLLSASTNGVLRLLGIDPHEEEEAAGEEEILMMAESGGIEDSEKNLIANIFQFNDIDASEICTHRRDVEFLDASDTPAKWEEEIHQSRHALYPLIGKDEDEVIGILNAKDFFRVDDQPREVILKEAVKEPFFIPGSIKADELFARMKKNHQRMAVVLDEYGGVDGIITLQDLIEELVGEIEEDETIEAAGDNTWLVSGNLPVDKLEQALNLTIPTESNTITGLVYDALERIPEPGETVVLTQISVPVSIEILEMDERTISQARVKKEQKKL